MIVANLPKARRHVPQTSHRLLTVYTPGTATPDLSIVARRRISVDQRKDRA